jgi:DNA mismatch endonuclease Vsr
MSEVKNSEVKNVKGGEGASEDGGGGVRMNSLERRTLEILRCCLGPDARIDAQARWLPGTPDFFITSIGVCVFVDGAFWHGGRGQKMRRTAIRFLASGDEDRAVFWAEKASTNETRDRSVNRQLRAMGLRVVRLKEDRINAADERAMAYVSKSLAMTLFKKAAKAK